VIQHLDPRPGLRYGGQSARVIEPDVYISKEGDDYIIQLNDEDMPQLRLNAQYRRMLVPQHGAIAVAQWARTGRTRAFGTQADDAISLVLELRVLFAKRLALGLGFLPITYPLCSPRLEQAIGRLELGPFRDQRRVNLGLQRWSIFELGTTVAQANDVLPNRCLRLEKGAAASLLPRE
jgi:hypothetical protein